MQQIEIKVSRYDIFDYVTSRSTFDPIEKCIDPIRYEVFDTFIYDSEEKKNISQGEKFCKFELEVSKLRNNAQHMLPDEIDRICEELAEIAPKSLDVS
jgi:hypothetical protein